MTKTTTEREDTPARSDAAAIDAMNLGRLEWQVSILLRNVEEQRQQARENYHALDAKIDNKIDSVNARIDRLFYWMLGLCVAIIITVVGSAIGLAIRLG